MKAKIKATGEIVEVHTVVDYFGTIMKYADMNSNNTFKKDELDFNINAKTSTVSVIDWEQRRYEIAKSAVQGYCISLGLSEDSETYKDIVKGSIRIADELIRQLKAK